MNDRVAAKVTPLDALHRELGAKMVPFAGYHMPLHYPPGILAEHHHTRRAASLFDVSHMGQLGLGGGGAIAALETLVAGDIRALAPWRMRYTLLTTDSGGILDDLIVTQAPGRLRLVVNAARAEQDAAHLCQRLGGRAEIEVMADRALLAVQGPGAAAALARHTPTVARLDFMSAAPDALAGYDCIVSRSGYTGEDGFEISVAATAADALARTLLAEPEVAAAGLGARDSLRLEAGLCLHGLDIGEMTTPVAAGLAWTIGKRRRAEGGFPGAEVILAELARGAPCRRVGIRVEGRVPARSHAEIRNIAGARIGEVTSGGFGPTVNAPIAMGYVDSDFAAVDTPVNLVIRGRTHAGRVAPLPFVAHRYVKG